MVTWSASMTRGACDDGMTLTALVDGAVDGLLLLSPTGFILRANDAAADLFGTTKEQLRQRQLGELMPRTGWEPGFVAKAVSAGGIVSRPCDLRGERKVLLSARATSPQSGGERFVVVTVRDITGVDALVGRIGHSAPRSMDRWSELRSAALSKNDAGSVIAESAALRAVKAKALDFANVDSPVLLVGETGTGKNVIARMIHQASRRATGSLREVNCGAIPAGLMESELFGYTRGAFTGADTRGKVGVVELAHNGTLLLDEVGDLPQPLQVKLLTFLESGEIWPVGATKPKHLDVRVIAATNANLSEMVAQGGFRKDLFYRLNVLIIQVPPLRERPEDIPPLVEMMLRTLERKVGKRAQLSSDALALLLRYPFPGNVRELWNLVERLVVCAKGETIDVPDFPLEVVESALDAGAPAEPASLKQLVKKLEARIVRDALTRYGTQSKAAKHLGVGQATIARKARLYEIGAALGRQSASE
jgi:PAS domain S-box-containing protein